jgi:putative peptidoglycan lipid II flippase
MKFLLSKSLVVSFVTGTGMVMGLLADVLLASIFGLGQETDALFLALTVSQLLAIVVIQAVDQVCTPAFTSVLKEPLHFHDVVNATVTWSLIASAVLCVSLVGLSDVWMGLLALGSQEPVRVSASRLVPLTVGTLFFAIPSGVFATALKAQHRFGVAVADRLLQGLSVTACLVLFARDWGIAVVALAYLFAAIAYLGWLLLELKRTGYRLRPTLRYPGTEGGQQVRGMSMALGTFLFRDSFVLVERAIASSLPTGALSALVLASRVVKAIILLTDNSLSTVVFRQMSTSIHEEPRQLQEIVRRALHVLSFVNVPIVMVLILLRDPLARLLYQYGSMSAVDTSTIADIIGLYAPWVLAVGWEQVLLYTFFASRDYRAGSSFIAVVSGLHILTSVALAQEFGVFGLALSTTIVSMVSAGAAWLILRRRGLVRLKDVGQILLQVGLPVVAASFIVVGTQASPLMGRLMANDSMTGRFATLIVPIAIACIVYVLLEIALHRATVRTWVSYVVALVLRNCRRNGS